MKKNKNLAKIMMAWMLLITFMSVLAIKDLHVHHGNHHQHIEQETAHQIAEVSASCIVCDFKMNQPDRVKLFDFIPVLVSVKLHRPPLFNSIVVYRSVESVNAHAPPIVVA